MRCALAIALLLAFSPQEQEDKPTVRQLLDWATKHSRRTFAYDDQLTPFLERKIAMTADIRDDARAYEIALSLLASVRLAAVPTEDGSVRIVPGQNAPREALRVYASADALPKADEFCTLTVHLKHLSTRDVHAALINLTMPQNVVPVEAAGGIVLSDTASNLRKCAEILRQLDVPRRWSAYRIDVALLEGTSGPERSVPATFKDIDFTTASNRNRFAVLSEGFTRLDVGDTAEAPRAVGAPPVPAPARIVPTEAILRLGGATPFVVEMAGLIRSEEGPSLERLTVRDDRDRTQLGPRLLETRIELKEGSWTLVGAVPGEKEGTTLVVLARATRAAR